MRCNSELGTAGNRVFYLATPPRVFGPIAVNLGKAGISNGEGNGFARIVIEKPFGWDEDSARELYGEISTSFVESQIFRIDHYLARKPFRICSRCASPIRSSNQSGIVPGSTTCRSLSPKPSVWATARASYETTGAVRDIVQNHVLQVLSLFLMEPPTSFHPEAIRDEKVKLLRAIRPLGDTEDIASSAVRGQYTRGGTPGNLMAGYREEPGVDGLSSTETFVALRLNINNWRWGGVPIYVRTGKRLPQRVTEVAMEFQRPPQLPLFPDVTADLAPDALVVRVQPDEGLSLSFGAKVPGHEFRVRKASMDFSYSSDSDQNANPTSG